MDLGFEDPPFTILIVSHNKPHLLPEAVDSLLRQSFSNWQGILIDSGVLHDRGFLARFSWASDPRLRIVRSPETPALRRHKAMAPWCFNECFRRGWVQGELVMYLCDDDILYPDALTTFANAFRQNPRAMAMYASQDIGWIRPDGRREIVGERRALTTGGKCCAGRIMDCQVDYLQLCHRRAALRAFPNAEYWPEDKASGDHADGLFMEKLGGFFPILPIDIKISQNRRTPWSINVPVSAGDKTVDYRAAEDRPHETIMDAWSAVRNHLDKDGRDVVCREALANFQRQLRKLCEQDQNLRLCLASRRYLLVDRLFALLARVPGTVKFLKCWHRVLTLFTRPA